MDTQVDGQKDRLPNGHTRSWTERQSARWTYKKIDRQTDKQMDTQVGGQIDGQPDGHTNRWINKQMNRLTYRQVEKSADRQIYVCMYSEKGF